MECGPNAKFDMHPIKLKMWTIFWVASTNQLWHQSDNISCTHRLLRFHLRCHLIENRRVTKISDKWTNFNLVKWMVLVLSLIVSTQSLHHSMPIKISVLMKNAMAIFMHNYSWKNDFKLHQQKFSVRSECFASILFDGETFETRLMMTIHKIYVTI